MDILSHTTVETSWMATNSCMDHIKLVTSVAMHIKNIPVSSQGGDHIIHFS